MSSTREKTPKLNHFSWEEWDDQLFVVLHRLERRFVVKRYIERVLSNSDRWLKLAKSSFLGSKPIPRTYRMTQNDVKLMQNIFSWHCNGTLQISIVAGLDELIDLEDLFEFIEHTENNQENCQPNQNDTSHRSYSSSIVPTIPVGSNTLNTTKIGTCQTQSQQTVSAHCWIQINNVFIPYIIKSDYGQLLPYQVLVDCDLINQDEETILQKKTIKASRDDIRLFEQIIASSSSITFTLAQDLVLIGLSHLVYGLSKVPYVKYLNRHSDVNKSFRTVMTCQGGLMRYQSSTIAYIYLGKSNYISFDSFIKISNISSTRMISSLRRRAVIARSHEIDYLRLIEFYSNNCQRNNDLKMDTSHPQLLISTDDISRSINGMSFILDWSLSDYHSIEHRRIFTNMNTSSSSCTTRKATKRKVNTSLVHD